MPAAGGLCDGFLLLQLLLLELLLLQQQPYASVLPPPALCGLIGAAASSSEGSPWPHTHPAVLQAAFCKLIGTAAHLQATET